MLIDLSGEAVTGKDLEKRLDEAHITCNKNTIPNDPRSPFVTSGVRLGTPAVTTRGMNEADMDQIAEAIALAIQGEENVPKVRQMVDVYKRQDQMWQSRFMLVICVLQLLERVLRELPEKWDILFWEIFIWETGDIRWD